MLSELGRRPMITKNEGSFGDDLEQEIGLLLSEQRRQEADDLERELNLYRSGSAPPTVEGSLSAVGGLFGAGGGSAAFEEIRRANNGNEFTADEISRSDPAYLSYYYANVNLNPRLPPPLLSREELRFAQRLKGGNSVVGGIRDGRKNNGTGDAGGSRSIFSVPPGFDSKKQLNYELENECCSAEWDGDGLIGLSGLGLGSKQKSLAEIFQDDLGQTTSVGGHLSRPSSRNALDSNGDSAASAETELTNLHQLASGDTLTVVSANQVPFAGQNVGPASSYTYAAALSRSATPDPQIVPRVPSPCLTPIGSGRSVASEKRSVNNASSFNGVSPGSNGASDLAAALTGMKLSNGGPEEENWTEGSAGKRSNGVLGLQGGHNGIKQHDFLKNTGPGYLQPQAEFQKSVFPSRNARPKGSHGSALNGGSGLRSYFSHLDSPNSSFSNYGGAACALNPAAAPMMASQLGTGNLPPLFENMAAASAMGFSGIDSRLIGGGLPCSQNFSAAALELHNLGRLGSQMVGGSPQTPFGDPMYLQYLRSSEHAAQLAALGDPSIDRSFFDNSYMNLLELQKACLGAQKSQYGFGGKSGNSNHHGFYGSPTFGAGMLYPGSPLANHPIPSSPVGPGTPMRLGDQFVPFTPSIRNIGGGFMPWHLDSRLDDGFGSSLLEEFKSNKARCFELSEIAGHVVDFSADQYGSRFIQQKLETATKEEKNMVYQEIMPQALALMTDVFGNYVIQKFFEHGLASQRRELAGKLFGHVLTLSLQMYGCRVIQKAIEVVDPDQKIIMVQELDGHVMRCVRDQNGNHVIQKCIECVPEENIQFIVTTFFDQVVNLSTHPYGCRVIQRILEHCKDPTTQNKVMEEILSSVSMLAQDQYGNYVVQHVLEHGQPHERSIIIKELAGKIVQMSQQKFASNVVEKCLTFGDPTERELLVNEMLGSTDENEPLQAMMKDQFGNYVVQKVLETCEEQQRELILSRIKVHLNALKKYTYGKHIVARVEKLVAAGGYTAENLCSITESGSGMLVNKESLCTAE